MSTTPATPSVAPPELLSIAELPGWDEDTDVLVIGYGAAGASAALGARERGARVLVLERASGAGGTSAMAGGHLYLGGGTPVQTACGFTDTPQAMYQYLEALTPDPDPEKLRLYCEGSVAHFHWLESQGVPFERSYYPGKTPMQPGKECLIWSGNEKAWPYRDIASPAPRGHKVAFDGGDGGGSLLMQHLASAVEQSGAQVLFDVRVTQLVADESGRIVGARYTRDGAPRHVRATGGVVLAAGGYIMNKAMFASELAWLPRDLYRQGSPYDDGGAILMGVSAGGQALGLDRAFLTSAFYPPEELLKGILVNAEGRRFCEEDAYHSNTAASIVAQPQGIAYLVVDAETFAYPAIKAFNQRLVDGYETVEDMEAGLSLPPGSLTATLAAYNAAAEQGEDPEFHKHPDWVQPLNQAPYAAFDLSVGRARFAGFSLGGLRVTPDAQVQRADGSPVPGLYAAGACAWNIAQDARGYSSGTCLGEATFFGRRAGAVAAAG